MRALVPMPAEFAHPNSNQVRRLLVLGCLMIKMHILGEFKEPLDATVLCASPQRLPPSRHRLVTPRLAAPPVLSHGQVATGLLKKEEKESLTKKWASIASGPSGDGKKDRYPSKNRPAFAFQEASRVNCRLHRKGLYHIPHTFMGVEAAITQMSNAFEEVEHLGTTVIPLPYAQLTQLCGVALVSHLGARMRRA